MDVGRAKVDSARDALARRFPTLQVHTERVMVTRDNVARVIAGWDVVLDGTDSITTKFLINDASVIAGLPLVHGAVVGMTGQLMSIIPGAACYRCLFEAPPLGEAPTCQQAGVIGAFAGIIGALMATEALAILDGKATLANTLLVIDGARDRRRRVPLRRRVSCELHLPAEVRHAE
jgi:adenylyltransferase/sulfurtransferase